MKKWSPLLAIGELKIKATLRISHPGQNGYHQAEKKIINVGEDVVGVGKETLINCWWECKLVQPLWK
jgi:hypothetical protein